MNFSASVADKGASIGARQTAALFMENAILGFKIQSFTKVFSGIAISLGINGILSNYWR